MKTVFSSFPTLLRALCLVLSLSCGVAFAAKDDNPESYASPDWIKPGKTGLLKSKGKGMAYFLRVPRKYNAKTGSKLIVFLHGSNMNGLAYLRTFEGQKWAEEDILCCPNGENGSDPFGANNFGFSSGPLVAEVTQEVQKALKTTVTYVGGHSQGAFLTFDVIANFPDLYRGAFPMAGDCWMQSEPNLWRGKPEELKQREIAMAIIHGQADPVVKFSQGQHAYDCFRGVGWPKLRFFAPKELNHMFGLAPIAEALEWLDTVNGLNDKKAMSLAKKWAKDGEWAWVWHAAQFPKPNAPVLKAAEDAATKALVPLNEAMKGAPEAWIPQWIEFWRIHGQTAAAKPLVDEYLKKRSEQQAKATPLMNEAQGLFQASKRPEGLKVLEKLRKEASHTYEGFLAHQWLTEK